MQVENLGMRVSEYIPEGLLLPFPYHLYLPNGNELVLTIRTLFCKVLQRQLKFSLPTSPGPESLPWAWGCEVKRKFLRGMAAFCTFCRDTNGKLEFVKW